MTSLWLSKKKPLCKEYLKPFVAEMRELARTGVTFRRNGKLKSVQVKPVCCISDTIARPMIRNSKQFNGEYKIILMMNFKNDNLDFFSPVINILFFT